MTSFLWLRRFVMTPQAVQILYKGLFFDAEL